MKKNRTHFLNIAVLFENYVEDLLQDFAKMENEELKDLAEKLTDDSEQIGLVCVICEEVIEKETSWIQCKICREGFHFKCSGLEKMPRQEWTCDICDGFVVPDK